MSQAENQERAEKILALAMNPGDLTLAQQEVMIRLGQAYATLATIPDPPKVNKVKSDRDKVNKVYNKPIICPDCDHMRSSHEWHGVGCVVRGCGCMS